MVSRLVVVALLLAASLAGCADSKWSTQGALQSVPDGYDVSWPDSVVVGGQWSADGAPRVVQQLAPFSGVGRQHTYDPPRAYLSTYAPSVAVTNDGSILTTTLDAVQRSQDHGQTWEEVLRFEGPGVGLDRWETLDTDLVVDSLTGRAFASFAGQGGCQVLYASDDDGTTWAKSVQDSWPQGCADSRGIESQRVRVTARQKMFTAPHPGPTAALASVYSNAFFWCEVVLSVGPKCSTSLDGGQTFAIESLLVPPNSACTFENFGRGAGRSDGTVAIPLGAATQAVNLEYYIGDALGSCLGGPVKVAVSADAGVTWTIKQYPGDDARMYSEVPGLTITSDGTAYLAYRGRDALVHVLRSPDMFETWEGPFTVTHPKHTLAGHPSIVAGDDGRVAVAYLASFTPQEPGAQLQNASTDTVWHLYTSTAFDAKAEQPSWSVSQVNPIQDPLHSGCIEHVMWPDYAGSYCYNMGWFSSAAATPEGRIVVAQLDGCTPRNGCAFNPEGAFAHRDRQVSVSVQDSGPGLVASLGVLPSLGLEPPAPEGEPGVFHDDGPVRP